MRVNRWLTVLPFLFLLQISFCGQQEVDFALLTIEVKDDQGEPLAEAVVLLDGLVVNQEPPVVLELEPWVEYQIQVPQAGGWVFTPTSEMFKARPDEETTLVFTGRPPATIHVSAVDIWDEEIVGAEILVDGTASGATTPGTVLVPSNEDVVLSIEHSSFHFTPGHVMLNEEAHSELDLDFEGLPANRIVLGEDFNNTNCPGCPEAEEALWQAKGQASGEVFPLSWHLFWPALFDPFYQYNIEANKERWVFYGGYDFINLPAIFVDGEAVSDPQSSQEILDACEARLLGSPKLAMRVHSERSGDEVTVTVDGKVLSDYGAGSWRIYYGLAEAEVEEEDGGNGQTHFQNVVRHLNGVDGYVADHGETPSIGDVFDVAVGEFFDFEITFTPDFGVVNADELFAFVFVQAEGSREVLDAAYETHGGP